MENEHVDPLYKYVDDKIKLTKHELQDQITSINESLLETKRFLAHLDIDWIRWGLNEWILKRLSKSTNPTYSKIHQFLLTHSARAQEKALHSSDPISVAREFRKECEDYFKEHKLHPFMD